MSRRPALPIALYLTGRRVLVVGDGPGAEERARRLTDAGADVERIAAADWLPDQAGDAFLVVANGDDDEHNAQVARDARAAGAALVYAHDSPDLSDISMPALIRRGPLTIAIATDAVAPALARRLREQLQALFDATGDRIDDLVEAMRVRRLALPRGKRGSLYVMASRLHLRGAITVDEPEDGSGDV